jgi:hypothetical protein
MSDLPPTELERRTPGYREGFAGASLLHAFLLAAAIGLVCGVALFTWISKPEPAAGPLIRAEQRRA